MTKPQRKKTNQGFHYQVPFVDDSKEKKMETLEFCKSHTNYIFMPSPLLSLFKSHISIIHLQTHHAKKLAIYQACIIQPQLETSTSRGGEWAQLTKKSNSKHKQSKT